MGFRGRILRGQCPLIRMAGSFVVTGSLERETEVVQEERVVRMLADRLLVDLDGFRESVPLVGGIAQTEERLCIGGIDRMRAPPCSSASAGRSAPTRACPRRMWDSA